MPDLAWFIVSAGGFELFVLVGCLWLFVQPRSPAARRFLLLVAIVYTLASVYATSHAGARLLAAGYEPLTEVDVPPGRRAIVVLGSSSFTARDWRDNRFSIVDPPAASRVLEAVRIYRLLDAQWVVSSGGSVRTSDSREATGTTMRDALVRLGVPPPRIIVETRSRNTHDEAVIASEILAPLHVDHVILVTAQLHMRRSVGTFRAAGVTVIPAIARDPFSADPWRDWLVPSNLGLNHARDLAHELLGLVYYRLQGWYR